MTAERQVWAFDAAGQPPPPQMVMESPQTVAVDRPVIDPDTLQQVGRSGRSLAAKRALIDQIEDVAHCLKCLSSHMTTRAGHMVQAKSLARQPHPLTLGTASPSSR